MLKKSAANYLALGLRHKIALPSKFKQFLLKISGRWGQTLYMFQDQDNVFVSNISPCVFFKNKYYLAVDRGRK